MKKLIPIILLATASIASALEWQTCLEYVTRDAPNSSWTLKGQDDLVWIDKWQSTVAKPTQAELEAIEATAIAWKADKTKTADADFTAWTEREKALCKLFVAEINKLRALHGLPAYTEAQVKAALKAEM